MAALSATDIQTVWGRLASARVEVDGQIQSKAVWASKMQVGKKTYNVTLMDVSKQSKWLTTDTNTYVNVSIDDQKFTGRTTDIHNLITEMFKGEKLYSIPEIDKSFISLNTHLKINGGAKKPLDKMIEPRWETVTKQYLADNLSKLKFEKKALFEDEDDDNTSEIGDAPNLEDVAVVGEKDLIGKQESDDGAGAAGAAGTIDLDGEVILNLGRGKSLDQQAPVANLDETEPDIDLKFKESEPGAKEAKGAIDDKGSRRAALVATPAINPIIKQSRFAFLNRSNVVTALGTIAVSALSAYVGYYIARNFG